MTELYYCIGNQYTVERSPSPIEVEKRIRLLNNAEFSVVGIFRSPWDLNIRGGNKDRVCVSFNKPDGSEMAILLDPDVAGNKKVLLFAESEPDQVPFNRTVSVDKAVEVALHFLMFGNFPQGLTWSKYPSSPPNWNPSEGIRTD